MDKSLTIENPKKVNHFLKENILLLSTIALFIFFSIVSNGFLTERNIFVILRSMSIIAIIGLGLTFVLTVGEIDLSIASLPAMAGCLVPFLLEFNIHISVIVIIAFAVCLGFGLLNGIIISKTGLPGIIVTMALSMVVSGIAWTISNQRTNVVGYKPFLEVFGGTWGSFPIMAFWMAICAVIAFFLLHKTKFGKNVSFVGENKTAAKFAGIKVNLTIIIAFAICGLFCVLGGFLGVAMASSAHPAMLADDMMTVIAAVILGGTSLSGGKGSIPGTLLAAFFLAVISNGFLLMGVQQWVLHLVNGAVIIGVLMLRHSGTQSR